MIDADPAILSVGEAQEAIVERIEPLAPERRTLREAKGRVLAEPVVARVDVPPWDNSAMDGYALRAGDLDGADALPVALDLPAGARSEQRLSGGTAARIMTGAPLPDGADTVVPVERTAGPDGEGEFAGVGESVRFLDAVEEDENVRRRGEDVRAGDEAVPAGAVCGPAEIAMAATVGRPMLTVFPPPRVAILSTGDELVDVEEAGTADRIVNGNSYGLAAQVEESGAVPTLLPIVPDELEATRDAVDAALRADAVVSVGGVSVGERDYVRDALEEAGVEILFWRVALKPGGPTAFGIAPDGTPVFALPGNPVSALVTFELFARPALLRMQGRSDCFRRPLGARLEDAVKKRPGKAWYLRGRLRESDEEGWTATLAGHQGSGVLSSLVAANALIVLPREAGDRPAGATVEALPWGGVGSRTRP